MATQPTITGTPHTGPRPGLPAPPADPYAVQAPTMPTRPELNYGQHEAAPEELIAALGERMGLDAQTQAWALERVKREYAEGRPIEQALTNLFGRDVLGILGGSAGNADPNSQNRAFGLIGREASAASSDRDAALRQLEESGLSGGELENAKAQLINQTYGRVAGIRGGLQNKALEYMANLADKKKSGYALPADSGSGQALLGYHAQKYGVDTNADTARAGIDASLYSGDRDAILQRYGIDIGAAGQRRGQDMSEASDLRNYNLARERMKAEQDAAKAAKKSSIWGGVLGTLGSIVGTAVLPGIGTALGGRLGGALGNSFSSGGSQGSTQMTSGGNNSSYLGGGYATNLPQPYRP